MACIVDIKGSFKDGFSVTCRTHGALTLGTVQSSECDEIAQKHIEANS